QKELERARALAEAERQRAEEQTRFAARLKWLVRGLGLVAMVALAASAVALVARWEARRQAQLAEVNRVDAEQNAERARRQARAADEQQATANQLRSDSLKMADRMKTTLTRADFVAGSDQIEEGKIGRGLASLARSMRTDPTYGPAPLLTKQALSDHTMP